MRNCVDLLKSQEQMLVNWLFSGCRSSLSHEWNGFSSFFFRMRRLSLLEIIFSLIKMMPLRLINWKPSTSSHESNYENFNFISSWGLAHRPYFNEICNYIPLSFINGCRCFFLSHSFRFINFHFLLSYPNWTCINVHILFTFFQYARAIAIVVKKMRRRMHPSL